MKVLLIGFGEAGRAFADGWRAAQIDVDLSTYDVKLQSTETEAEMRAAAEERGVRAVLPGDDVYRDADVVFSLVTADQALEAARQTAPHMTSGQSFWDLNSVAPSTKSAAADEFTGTGVHYLDVAVLSPVHPKRHRAPLAISGPEAGSTADLVRALDLDAEVLSETVGEAATLKLLRSVVIKGMEAILVECYQGCEATGMNTRVLSSLAASFPGIDWPQRVDYVLDRVANHGDRRAAEMREAAIMLEDLGIDSTVTEAVAERLAKGVGKTTAKGG